MNAKSIPKSMNNHAQNGATKVMQNNAPNGRGKEGKRRRGFWGDPNTLRYVIRGTTPSDATPVEPRLDGEADHGEGDDDYPRHAPSRKRGGGNLYIYLYT